MRRNSTGDGPSASETPIEDETVNGQGLDPQPVHEVLAHHLCDLAQAEGLSTEVVHFDDTTVQVVVREHAEAKPSRMLCMLMPEGIIMRDASSYGDDPAIISYWRAQLAQIAGRR